MFLAGRHSDVMASALLDPGARFAPEETPYVVGALAGLSQFGDAELLLRHQRDLLTDDAIVFAHAHIAIAAATTGRYAAARRHLGAAASLRDRTSEAESLFLLYFGLAQYRYATGRLGAGVMNIHRAGSFLRRAPHDYIQLLNHELSGHLKAATGDARDGIAHLVAAGQCAQRLGRVDDMARLERTKTLYEARYLLRPKEAVQKLRLALSHVAAEDLLGAASLQLELARQHLLRGRVDDARMALTSALEGAAVSGHRRYEIAGSLRMTDLLLATGAFAEAALLAATTERSLGAEGDDLLALEVAQRRVASLTRMASASGGTRLQPVLDAARERLNALSLRTGFVAPDAPRARPKSKDLGLNHRQVELLRLLGERELIDVQTYKKQFSISEITACRDLAQLAREGYLQRLGKARATRYVKPGVERST